MNTSGSKFITATIKSSDKQLGLFAANFGSGNINPDIIDIAQDIFEPLSQFVKDNNQVLYIRDLKDLAIDRKYPGGHSYNRHEAMIAVPEWPANDQQLKATIAHELHHIARWQNAGYGTTLGEALSSEGMATYYESLISSWIPPWAKASFSAKDMHDALADWDSQDYDHAEWFFDGKRGKWVGYAIGYKLAQQRYGSTFDLRDSLSITADVTKDILISLDK